MRDEAKRTADVVVRAIEAGADFAREAWRDAGVVLALCAIAGAVVFSADRAGLPHDVGQVLHQVGWAALGLLFAPKLGALYRLALGGPAVRSLGPGGLQWRRMEWRLLGTAVALSAFAVIVLAPLLALVFLVLAALRPMGVLDLGPVGPLGIGFLLTAPIFAGLFAAAFAGLARLAVTLPAEAAEAQPRFARGWFITRGWSLATAAVALLAFVAPLAALTALQGALDWMQAGNSLGLGGRAWPLADAVVAGLVLGGLSEFLAVPFCVGAFAELYLALAPADEPATVPSEAVEAEAGGAEALEPTTPDEVERIDPPPAPTESPEPPAVRPRLRLVHSVDTIATPWRPLAPEHVAREAEVNTAAESQEPSGP